LNCQQRATYRGDLGHETPIFISDVQRTAVDFGKLQDSTFHFNRIAENCGWMNRYISMAIAAANWKMTPHRGSGLKPSEFPEPLKINDLG
jgi:hypothetical protein